MTLSDGDLLEWRVTPTGTPTARTAWSSLLLCESLYTQEIQTTYSDSSGNYSFTTTYPITEGYHAVVEYADSNGKYNTKSLPFLTSA